MTKVLEKKKFYLTPHLVDRIYNIHPEFTWDIHEFVFFLMTIVTGSQGWETEKHVDSERKVTEFLWTPSSSFAMGRGHGQFASGFLWQRRWVLGWIHWREAAKVPEGSAFDEQAKNPFHSLIIINKIYYTIVHIILCCTQSTSMNPKS